MDAPSTAVAADDEDYEICNDHGFVYKRRRGLYPDVAPPSAQPAGPCPEAARRRRRNALRRLRGRRLRELQRWEALEGKLLAQLPDPRRPPPAQAAPSSSDPSGADAADISASPSVLDDLLAQAEVQEAILKKVAGLCAEVDALCRAHEEDIVDAIAALPLWDDPKELLISLQSPDAHGDLNFIKYHHNEGNKGFQRSDRRATETGGYDRCQEAVGMCLATVQSIEKSGRTVKRGPSQCNTPARLGDDPSIVTENGKKKRVVSSLGSKSANKPKRFYQPTSPNPVSVSAGPTTRRATAAKMRKQEAPL